MADRRRTVFLDRDGVINRKMLEGEYVTRWDEFEFLPGAIDALRLLRRKGYRIIVVTNQRGIAKRVMTEQDLQHIHGCLRAELVQADADVDSIYCCPHDEGQCKCRKPHIGLFSEAKRDYADIAFPDSLMIGDSLSDMEAGATLGCRNILVASGSNAERLLAIARACGIAIEEVAPSLFEAVVRYANVENRRS